MRKPGLLIIGSKLYVINQGAYFYAENLFGKILAVYKPKSANEFIKHVNRLGGRDPDFPFPGCGEPMIDPSGKPLASVSIYDQVIFEVNLTTRKVNVRNLPRGTTKHQFRFGDF